MHSPAALLMPGERLVDKLLDHVEMFAALLALILVQRHSLSVTVPVQGWGAVPLPRVHWCPG